MDAVTLIGFGLACIFVGILYPAFISIGAILIIWGIVKSS